MKYRAFLSYSHADEDSVRWLMRKLESYRVPKSLVGTPGLHGPVPATLGKVFRDRDELASAVDLSDTIKSALAESESLVVVCSTSSAGSHWVNNEIRAFREQHGSSRVFCFLIEGDPASTEPGLVCFPPAVLEPDHPNEPPREPLAADARKEGDGRSRAFLKLVAGLLGVGYDALAQRETQKRNKRLALVAAFSLAGMTLASVLAVTAYLARNDAERRQEQAEDIIGFMLGDLRENLSEVGRLDLMRSVDDKATGYFSELDPRDLSDRILEEQARSLTGIGEVRLTEGNHDEAMTAFREAHARTTALQGRAPGDPDRLFDLSQAEFWIGYVAWQQGRLDDASDWLTRYRDSAIHLSAMDPSNFDWQREVAYGHHNLAVLDEKLGNIDAAEKSMLAERDLYLTWLQDKQDDPDLRYEYANVVSWLGSLALQKGKLLEAEAFFLEQKEAMTRIIADAPDKADWREVQLDALLLLIDVQVRLGKLVEAQNNGYEAMDIAVAKTRLDPENNTWRWSLGIASYWHAVLVSEDQAARSLEAEQILARVNEIEPESEEKARWYARGLVLSGRLALHENRLEMALSRATHAQSLLRSFWSEGENEKLRISMAKALIFEGEVLSALGDSQSAETAWRDALSLLEFQPDIPAPFNRLPAQVRVKNLLGLEIAAEHQRRLLEAGYDPPLFLP